jgi:hypothetical protein
MPSFHELKVRAMAPSDLLKWLTQIAAPGGTRTQISLSTIFSIAFPRRMKGFE